VAQRRGGGALRRQWWWMRVPGGAAASRVLMPAELCGFAEGFADCCVHVPMRRRRAASGVGTFSCVRRHSHAMLVCSSPSPSCRAVVCRSECAIRPRRRVAYRRVQFAAPDAGRRLRRLPPPPVFP